MRSIATAALEVSGAICAATPSVAPGVVEAMTQIAWTERAASAEGLALSDGSSLGSFNGPAGVFADSRVLGAAVYGSDDSLRSFRRLDVW